MESSTQSIGGAAEMRLLATSDINIDEEPDSMLAVSDGSAFAQYRRVATVALGVSVVAGVCAVMLSVQVPTSGMSSASEDQPIRGVITLNDEEPTGAQKVDKKFESLISELDIKVLGCDESNAKLKHLPDNADLYVLNFADRSCTLEDLGDGVDAHMEPPAKHYKTCAVYCWDEECDLALKSVKSLKNNMRERCDELWYFQGGAKCWVTHNFKLTDREHCAKMEGIDLTGKDVKKKTEGCDNC